MNKAQLCAIVFIVALIAGCSQQGDTAKSDAANPVPIAKSADGKPLPASGQNGSKAFRGADNINEVPEQYRAMVKSYQDANKNAKEAPKVAAPK